MGMEIVWIDPRELVPYENNPRMNEQAVDACVKSIEAYGFKVPIIVDKKNVIVAGHTRMKAAIRLGMDKVPCVIADDLTDEQIKAFRIADNKVSDFSIWDNRLLLQELEEISDFGLGLFTGFEFGDIPQMDVFEEKTGNKLDAEEVGAIYEIVFKSESRDKIERIKELWDSLDDEEEYDDEDE